ncbi:MAG: hypothetical protein HY865_20850 [Chloroflexi bacterium]|nr:hypothetical protein [Chloroflexota bacterium]
MVWDEYCNQYLTAMELAKSNLPKEDIEHWNFWGWSIWVAEFFTPGYFQNLQESKSEIIPNFGNMAAQETRWFVDALKDKQRKWFALCLIEQAEYLPEVLFPALVEAAVREDDASLNEHFVGAACRFGSCKVAKALFDYVEHGTDVESSHALCAAYWVGKYSTSKERISLRALLKDIAHDSKYADAVRD